MVKKRRDRTAERRNRSNIRDAETKGFNELEGDFEAERHRAAAAMHERAQPYEHGEDEKPVLPGTTAGLTHP